MQVEALAPEFQEIKEKDAIQADLNVQQYLESLNARITDISNRVITSNGAEYTVETDTGAQFNVNITYIPREENNLGPLNFQIDFSKIVSKDQEK